MLSVCRRLGWLLAATVLVAGANHARAQEPACTAEAVGRVTCIAGKLCNCRFERASYSTSLPDGFRWDCGILRPACGGPAPTTIDSWQDGLPDDLAIDQSRTIINQRTGKQGRWPRH